MQLQLHFRFHDVTKNAPDYKTIAAVTIPKFENTVDLRTNNVGDLCKFDWTQTPVVATYS
jgi:hypothetical protein